MYQSRLCKKQVTEKKAEKGGKGGKVGRQYAFIKRKMYGKNGKGKEGGKGTEKGRKVGQQYAFIKVVM
jgi:hypothetical protein